MRNSNKLIIGFYIMVVIIGIVIAYLAFIPTNDNIDTIPPNSSENKPNDNKDDKPTEDKKDYIYLNILEKYELEVGNQIKLIAYRNHQNKISIENVTWTSSDSSIATVTSGTVVAKKQGKAVITAKSSDGLSVSISITVKQKSITNITITNCKNNLKLKVGETYILKYIATPETEHTPYWTSSDNSIISVSNTGKLTANKDGNAKITLSINNKLSTCNVTVYSTYTSNITSSSTTNQFHFQKQNLRVSVYNHNNEKITNGLKYEWYLNNDKINNANSSSYVISEYGTYKVKVYKNSVLISESTYQPEASELKYTFDADSSTKFVYVNNPEGLSDIDMVDNGKIINKATFDKNIELYFEHNRGTSTPFYYGIRIYNPNNFNVDLSINKSGSSACYNGCLYYAKTWEEYFSSNVVYRLDETNQKDYKKEKYTLTPGQYLYLWLVPDESMLGKTKFVATISNYKYAPYNDYLNENYKPINYSWGWAFDGVLNMSAKLSTGAYLSSKNGYLEVSNIAVSRSFYKSENKDKINKASILATRKNNSLTGEYLGKPQVINDIKFTITDSTPKGNLTTYYSTDNTNSNKLVSGWVTNISGSNLSVPAYQKEMIPLEGINSLGNKYKVTPFSSITTANYAVKYLENITITNNSSKSRTVAFYINTASGTATNSASTTLVSFVTNNNQEIIKNSYTNNGVTIYPKATFGLFDERTNVQVWNITISKGKTVTIPSIVLMGGMSYGTLSKMVCVDNTCYDAFYQRYFNW